MDGAILASSRRLPNGSAAYCAPLLRVMDEPRTEGGFPAPKRHPKSLQDQLGFEVRGHRPADYFAAENVQDEGEVEKPSSVWTYVMSATQSLTGAGAEVVPHQVGSGHGARIGAGGALLRTAKASPQAPALRISLATRLRPQRTLRAFSSA